MLAPAPHDAQITRPESHTDMADTTETLDAFESLLPTTGGDRIAAAILAVGAVLADAISQLPRGR